MKRFASLEALEQGFKEYGYIAGRDLLTSVFLLGRLGRPLLLEGHAGVGKTEVAKVLARLLGTDLIRLQCYEGLDVNATLYEWNYHKQLLAIRAHEQDGRSREVLDRQLFGPEFLLERPLLKAITRAEGPAVLLIDEVDRADEEFEAFLLELLSDFQVTIPEMGTIKAVHIPHVILTSNRVRELSDALKRRCLYHWIDYPSYDKELAILQQRVPDVPGRLARQVVAVVQGLRGLDLGKPPGVAETLDWAVSLMALGIARVEEAALDSTLGCLLKSNEDVQLLQSKKAEVLAIIRE
jgi:MoxR-like ATPase